MEGKIKEFFKDSISNSVSNELSETDQKITNALKKGTKNRIWDRESLPEFI